MGLFKGKRTQFELLQEMLHYYQLPHKITGKLNLSEINSLNKKRLSNYQVTCGLYIHHEDNWTTIYLFNDELQLIDVALIEMEM